ncbi:hypothetical protein C8R46DRAFT_898151, partial [Mycena filopes]
ENRYYGAYNKMLEYCFGAGFDFVVAPQVPEPDNNSQILVDFPVYLIVFDVAQHPVFFIEVKNDAGKITATRRQGADRQTRRRYDELLRECPIPLLYGITVLGTSMQVYCGDKARWTVTPPFVPADRQFLLPTEYLQDQWTVDILSPGGFLEMKRIVAFVKEESAKL